MKANEAANILIENLSEFVCKQINNTGKCDLAVSTLDCLVKIEHESTGRISNILIDEIEVAVKNGYSEIGNDIDFEFPHISKASMLTFLSINNYLIGSYNIKLKLSDVDVNIHKRVLITLTSDCECNQ